MELQYTLTEAHYRELVPMETSMRSKSVAAPMGLLLVMCVYLWRKNPESTLVHIAVPFLILMFVVVMIMRYRITSDKGIEAQINKAINAPAFGQPHTLRIEKGKVIITHGSKKTKVSAKQCALMEKGGSLSYLTYSTMVVASIPNDVLDANGTRATLDAALSGKIPS